MAHGSIALPPEASADVVRVGSAEDAVARLAHDEEIDVAVLELGSRAIASLDVVRNLRKNARPEVPIVVVAATGDTDLALLAIGAGAQEVVPSSRTDGSTLTRAIAFARERQRCVSRAERERALAVRATAAKTEFLANLSHEIRTPLNTMLGMAELLEETGLSSEQSRRLETLRRGGDHLLAIVDDALDLSRVEAGRLTLERGSFDLARLVDGAVAFLRPAAQRKGIELRVV
jgi:signal transduction histidine kinase